MSKEIALEEIACCKAEKSNTINHPITRYNSKEITSNLPVKNSFKKVPKHCYRPYNTKQQYSFAMA